MSLIETKLYVLADEIQESDTKVRLLPSPLSSEYGTCRTVKALAFRPKTLICSKLFTLRSQAVQTHITECIYQLSSGNQLPLKW